MKKDSLSDNLISALRNIPSYMREKIESLKDIGADLSKRNDIVWHMLVQSMSGMGNNRGYAKLILNKENYNKVSWETVERVPKDRRFTHIHSALTKATVRMPGQKASWLTRNFSQIEMMGGPAAARGRMRALQGRPAKLEFFKQFDGIGEKYGRNIWMDLCDPDFVDSIAIDTRLQKIYDGLGISTNNYSDAEQTMLGVARKAELTGWELDRLLFHFSEHFYEAIGIGPAPAVSTPVHAKHPAEENHKIVGLDSLVREWENIYSNFLRRRNTETWGIKKDYANAIIREFSGRIPLATVVIRPDRKELSRKLFNKSNAFNFVIYPLGMGVWLGELALDGEDLVPVGDDLT